MPPEPRASSRGLELALLLGAGLISLGDLWALSRAGSNAPWSLLLTALGVILLGAGLLALVARLTLVLLAPLPAGTWRRSMAGALVALPVILPVSILLFQGTGISTRSYAPAGPYLVAPILYGAVVVALRLVGAISSWIVQAPSGRARAARLVLAPLCLGVGGLLYWADRQLYPHQYLYLHWVLLLLTLLAWTGAARLGVRRAPSGWLAPVVVLVSAALCTWMGLTALTSNQQRQLFDERAHAGARLVGVYRSLLDFDGDHHSVIFGGRDCDNLDPAVHPFARELPGNGVDEDCDGQDQLRPAPRPATRRLDEREYRRRLVRWRSSPAAARLLEQTSSYNVVLVVVDALRADQLQPTPENRDNQPQLMGLMDQCVHFTRAFSTGAGTDIGMATLFTGQLDPFARNNTTLLHAYQAAGFSTYGVFQREVEKWVGRQFSLDGLDGRKVVVNDPYRRDVGTHATSRQVTDQGLAFTGAHRDERFFLWLHYFDVHEHHQIDPDHLPDPERYRLARGLPFYRGMIHYVDLQVGRLLAGLERQGLARRTIVLLVADHGEGLAQSPRLPQNHGDVLYNPLVHVPLGLRIPGLAPRRVPFPVSVADIFPTMIDLSGLERRETFGVSLAPFVLGGQASPLAGLERLDHPLLMYETKQRALVRWPHKLLLWRDQELVELYNLERDFGEERNLSDDEPELARSLAAQLNSYPVIVVDRLSKKRR